MDALHIVNSAQLDHVIVGGGIFGCYVAELLSRRGERVHLVEELPGLLGRASYWNQARVHGGYHYPRSFLTANRTRANFHTFVEEFGDCVVRNFPCYYGIAREFSLVSARQFEEFCKRIVAPVKEAPEKVRRMFDPILIEAVFETEEFVFDVRSLRTIMQQRLEKAGVTIAMETRAERIETDPSGALQLSLRSGDNWQTVQTRNVWLCTYSDMNDLLLASDLPGVPLDRELTEMALVDPPEALNGAGVTLMDGPFFSLMPFPAANAYSLSHVRYTPHASWRVGHKDDEQHRMSDFELTSRFPLMRRDAARFVPVMAECRYRESIWEFKAKLPRSVGNDSRPILFRRDHGAKGVHCVLGGKIDSVFDIEEAMSEPAPA